MAEGDETSDCTTKPLARDSSAVKPSSGSDLAWPPSFVLATDCSISTGMKVFLNLFKYEVKVLKEPVRTGAFGIRGFKEVLVST